MSELPSKVDLSDQISTEVLNQGLLNACIACALSVAVELYLKKEQLFFDHNGASSQHVSTMFIYYHMRLIEDKLPCNVPLTVELSVKSLIETGFCCDALWPYPFVPHSSALQKIINNKDFSLLEPFMAKDLKDNAERLSEVLADLPSRLAQEQAAAIKNNGDKTIKRRRLSIENGLDELKQTLSNGLPFIFGLDFPESFFSIPTSGEMTIPSQFEKRLGGHALVCVGYDDKKAHLKA
ncbi:MAG: hypothetical protein MJK04_28990, partial [Psychrosphaera sp.]|nr:hypothetical protein [Psychrosphaera sp.]